MSRLPIGDYIIRPIDSAPGEGLSIGPRIIGPPFPVLTPVKAGSSNQIWHTIHGQDGNFKILHDRAAGTEPVQYQLIHRNNVLFATLTNPPDDFRIESAGNDLWVIGIPNQDLLLTFSAIAVQQLTFKPANGSSAQRFKFQSV